MGTEKCEEWLRASSDEIDLTGAGDDFAFWVFVCVDINVIQKIFIFVKENTPKYMHSSSFLSTDVLGTDGALPRTLCTVPFCLEICCSLLVSLLILCLVLLPIQPAEDPIPDVAIADDIPRSCVVRGGWEVTLIIKPIADALPPVEHAAAVEPELR
ncbi:hypothetical protein HAX54_016021 [Datura stramonium]|uniref:Uncharacterized protein n=1 Tax=Datura stramonium TaxID=4076 RepID=A0ABS8S1X3_DATST|nr:hypothetical protein [Datura stramonium]